MALVEGFEPTASRLTVLPPHPGQFTRIILVLMKQIVYKDLNPVFPAVRRVS